MLPNKLTSAVFWLAVLSPLSTAAPLKSILDEGTHCVAYKAMKTMFFISSGAVIGKNCDVSAQVLPELGGLYHIEVTIPLRSFQSGDADRDLDVMKTLKADVRPEMLFRSQAMTAEQWHALFGKAEFNLAGELTIGAKSFPVKVASRYIERNDSAEVDGMTTVRFQDFALAPPSVGAGIVAKTNPEFEVHFHLLGSRILGADSIRLAKKDDSK